MPPSQTWHAVITVPAVEAPAVQARLDALPALAETGAISQFESGPDTVDFEFYLEGAPPDSLIDAIAAATGTRPDFAPLPAADWVSRSQAGVQPFHAGRFFVTPTWPSVFRRTTIVMTAGQAFGTGQHETTRGCLLALDRILKKKPPQRTLDLGCGSGILAIALAKAGARHVIASDNDPIAVRVAKENRRHNRVPADYMTCIISEGFRHPALHGQFDLIVANILARPLMRLAPAIGRHLAPGGTVILSGLLRSQEKAVLAAYQEGGMTRRQYLRLGDWSTLVLGTGADRSRGGSKNLRPSRNG